MGGRWLSNWTRLARRRTGARFTVHSKGGTGYVGRIGPTFGEVLASHDLDAFDLIVIFGSCNDEGSDVRAAVRAAFDLISGPLLVIGPPSPKGWDVPELLAVRDVVRDESEAFIDPIADRWFYGADQRFIGSDGTHPTNAGHAYMAERIAPAIKAILEREPS
jgi:hypothetical protein